MAANKDLKWSLKAEDKASATYKKVAKEQEKLNGKLEKTQKEADKLTAKTGGMEKSFGGLGKTLVTVGTAMAAFKVAADSVKLAASFQSLEESYSRMTQQAGINGDLLLSKLQQVSAGTVSNNNLILASNRAMALGVGKDMDTVTKLMEIARLKGRALGLDTTQAFSDIVTGIGRGSPLILDNLGITIKLGEAQDKYAKSLGKTAAQLTDTEKKNALLFAVLEEGNKELENAGELTVTVAERMQQLTARIENLKIAVGQVLLPAVMFALGVMEKLADGVAIAFDVAGSAIDRTGDTTDTFGQKARKFLDSFTSAMKAGLILIGIGVTTIISGMKMAAVGAMSVMGKVWNAVLKAIDWSIKGVKNAINEVINLYNKAMVKIGQLDKVASPIRVSGTNLMDKYGITQDTFDELNDAISFSFEEMVGNVSAGADKMFAALDEKMPKISGSAAQNYQKLTENLGDSLGDLDEASKKALDKTADAMMKVGDKYDDMVDKAEEALAKLDDAHGKAVRSITAKIDDLKKALQEARAAYSSTLADLNQQEAERAVSEEQAIAALEREISSKMSGGELTQQEAEGLQAMRNELAERKRIFTEYMAGRADMTEEMDEARRRASLSDFQRFVEDINNRRAEEEAAHQTKVAELNAEIEAQRQALAEEEVIYQAKRQQYIDTQAAFGEFHDRYLAMMEDMEAQTQESVDRMNAKLEEMQRILSSIESVKNEAGLRASLIGGASASGSAGSINNNNTANIQSIIGQVTVTNEADEDRLAQKIVRELQLANMGA